PGSVGCPRPRTRCALEVCAASLAAIPPGWSCSWSALYLSSLKLLQVGAQMCGSIHATHAPPAHPPCESNGSHDSMTVSARAPLPIWKSRSTSYTVDASSYTSSDEAVTSSASGEFPRLSIVGAHRSTPTSTMTAVGSAQFPLRRACCGNGFVGWMRGTRTYACPSQHQSHAMVPV